MRSSPQLPLIVVEGPFAVFHLVQSGFPACVAIFGSSLSEAQAMLLIETGRPLILLLDGDGSGRAGAESATELLASRAFVRVVSLPDGNQPDHLSFHELNDLLHLDA